MLGEFNFTDEKKLQSSKRSCQIQLFYSKMESNNIPAREEDNKWAACPESIVQRPKVIVNMHSAVHLMLLAGRQNSACITENKRIHILRQVVVF